MSGWNNQGDSRGDQQHPHEFTEQEQYAYQCQQLRDAFENGGLDAADPRNLGYYNMAYPGQQNPFLSYRIPAAPYGGGYQYNTGGSGMYPSTGYNSGGYGHPNNTPFAPNGQGYQGSAPPPGANYMRNAGNYGPPQSGGYLAGSYGQSTDQYASEHPSSRQRQQSQHTQFHSRYPVTASQQPPDIRRDFSPLISPGGGGPPSKLHAGASDFRPSAPIQSRSDQTFRHPRDTQQSTPTITMEDREKDAWQKITNKRADIDEPQDDPNVDYPLRLDKRESTKKAVETNHFELKFDDQVQFYEYEITGFPVGINRTVLRRYFRDAVAAIPWLHLGRSHYGTDGLKTIVAWKNIHQNVTTRLTASRDASTTFGPFDIPDGKKQLSKTPDENGSYNLYQPVRPVNVKLVRKFGIASPRSYVQGQVSPPSLWTSSAEVKALNIVIASCFDITRVFQHNASRFFVRNTRRLLGNGTSLATLQGFFYTIKPTIGGIMLNVSFATSAFYEPILVSDFIGDGKTFPNPAKRLEALVGVRVVIKYSRGKTTKEQQADWDYEEGRIKTIQGIGPLNIRSQTFKESKDASPIPVEQYLIRTYGRQYLEPDKHLAVNLGAPGKESWHSPTDLEIVPDQIYAKLVPEHLTDSMLEEAKKTPLEMVDWFRNQLLTNTGAGFLRITPGPGTQPLVRCTAIKINPALVKTPSTILPYPSPVYKAGAVNLYNEPRAWVNGVQEVSPRWNLRSRRFVVDGPIRGRFQPVLLIAPGIKHEHDQVNILHQARSAMLQQFGNYGFGTVKNHQCRNIILSSTSVDGLRAGLDSIPRAPAQKATTVVFLFLPKKHLEDYQCFKSMADCDYGFHTICITEASMVEETKPRKDKVRGWIAPPYQKDLAAYFGNVMMKVNLKFGGINHTTDFVKQTMQDTMVLGA